MATKTITVCDGCGTELKRTSEKYFIDMKTDKFWNGVENDCRIEHLVFCEDCAVSLKKTMENLCGRMAQYDQENQ